MKNLATIAIAAALLLPTPALASGPTPCMTDPENPCQAPAEQCSPPPGYGPSYCYDDDYPPRGDNYQYPPYPGDAPATKAPAKTYTPATQSYSSDAETYTPDAATPTPEPTPGPVQTVVQPVQHDAFLDMLEEMLYGQPW